VYKGWFPYDRYYHYGRCDCWRKRSAIVAIMWKPLFTDRSDRSSHVETSSVMETALRSKSQRPLNCFGSDRSRYMEASLKLRA